MANYIVSDTTLTSIANAIRSKAGTASELIFPTEFVSTIQAIDVSDDTMPVADGDTHIRIYIDPVTPENRRKFILRWLQTEENGVSIDWGDGSLRESYSSYGYADNHEHTYSEGGTYDITLEVLDGTMAFEGTSGNTGANIYGGRSVGNAYNRARIRRMIVGDDVTSIGEYSFTYADMLETITIPNTVTGFGDSVFNSCYALKSIVIPSGVTSIGESAFYNCYGLSSVVLPDNLTTIGNKAFYNCYNLSSIIIPASVTQIGSEAFYSCYGLSEYHLKSETPPTLSAVSAFTGFRTDVTKFYVPKSSEQTVLNDYKAATNWSSYANYMEEEPE